MESWNTIHVINIVTFDNDFSSLEACTTSEIFNNNIL